MADAIRFLGNEMSRLVTFFSIESFVLIFERLEKEPNTQHHICVAPFSCSDVLKQYKNKVRDQNIQNTFYKKLGVGLNSTGKKITFNVGQNFVEEKLTNSK